VLRDDHPRPVKAARCPVGVDENTETGTSHHTTHMGQEIGTPASRRRRLSKLPSASNRPCKV